MKKKVLLIIPSKDFRDEEFNIPFNFFNSKNLDVVVASNEIGKAKGMSGTYVEVMLTIDELNPKDFDAVILVGGKGAEVFWQDKTLHRFLKDAKKHNKIIAASYKSPITLAYAGLLKNKRATVWIEDKDILDELGAFFTGASIEIDGNIITTDGPHSTKMFAEEVYNMLNKIKS